jgi:hypothetical protein
MAVVAIAGCISGGYVWLRPTEPSDVHYHDATTTIAGHVIPDTSPVFWIIVSLTLAVFLGLCAGVIAFVVRTVSAIGRR